MGVFSVRKTTEQFIDEAKKVHGDKYSYEKVDYQTTMDRVIITCPKHGEFSQVAMSHVKGFGCKKCGVEKRSRNRIDTTLDFIKKAKRVHGSKYDYSLVKYIKSNKKVSIICKEHGVFLSKCGDHINKKSGCPECKKKRLSLTIDEFIEKSNNIHQNRYDYSKVEYKNTYSKVKIICKDHGEFLQEPHSHLKGNGCVICGRTTSNAEIEITNFLIKNNISCNKKTKFLDNKDVDILSERHKICIEYDGLYWHSELFKDKNYHLNKTNMAEDMGYSLIHIYEDEWKKNKSIIKSILLSKFGIIKNKIYARKCECKEISLEESKTFLNKTHLQGFTKSNTKLGLFYNNELVSVMLFEKLRKSLGNKNNSNDKYNLCRFSSKLNTVVIGGASKLINYFIRNYDVSEIITYADRRYSNGNMYRTLGFEEVHTTIPDYSYFHRNSIDRHHRFNFRKKNLEKMGFNCENKTEHEIMLENNYLRIYDCGKIKFRKKIK